MSYSINNQATADTYTDRCTLQNVPPGRVNGLQISNAAAYVTLQREYSGPSDNRWESERFMLPLIGALGATKVTGIKFRSAVAGLPATVSATIEGG